MTTKSKNITAVAHRIDTASRWKNSGHKGGVIWFTGLSGSGKTTLAFELEKKLFDRGYNVYVLDGDNVRHGLCSDLGFSHDDRTENIRRIGEMAALFADAGFIVISAFISPYREDRRVARDAAGDGFNEVYLSASVEACEGRDPKGLYAKARTGEIPDFTGISAPYEAPEQAELTIDTATLSVEESLDVIAEYTDKTFSL